MAESGPVRNRTGSSVVTGPILVVDDDAQLQRTIRWLLEDEGLTVETASNGEEALIRAHKQRPALVILDLNLPALEGEGVASVLHSVHGAALPIVVISSDSEVEQRARSVGAQGWLCKPFEIDELVTAVWRALAPA